VFEIDMVKLVSMKQSFAFVAFCAVLSVGAQVAAAPASPPPAAEAAPDPAATPRPKQVEGVGDVRWSDSLGFVGPGSAPEAGPAKSPVLDVPAKAGNPQTREPKRGQNVTDTRGRAGFAMVGMQPVNYGVEDEYLDYTAYGALFDVAFLFPVGKYTLIPLELGSLLVLGGTDVSAEAGGPTQDLEYSSTELVPGARTGLDVRVLDAPDWEVRVGPRIGVMAAIATASAAPAAEESDMEVELRWEFGAQAAVTYGDFSLEPRWRLIKNSALDVHTLGVDGTWMTSKDFGLFARYETRVAASGGFRYALGRSDGDVDSLGLAHLRGMPERNTIIMGIVF
jgi:hypothetical protein